MGMLCCREKEIINTRFVVEEYGKDTLFKNFESIENIDTVKCSNCVKNFHNGSVIFERVLRKAKEIYLSEGVRYL